MSFHVSKHVTPSAALADGGAVHTLLDGAEELKVVRPDEETLELQHPLLDVEFGEDPDPDHTDAVDATDLTFEGRYTPGASSYVVHALGAVMLPVSAGDTIKKAYKDIQVGV
jgi:hypothetical protein